MNPLRLLHLQHNILRVSFLPPVDVVEAKEAEVVGVTQIKNQIVGLITRVTPILLHIKVQIYLKLFVITVKVKVILHVYVHLLGVTQEIISLDNQFQIYYELLLLKIC